MQGSQEEAPLLHLHLKTTDEATRAGPPAESEPDDSFSERELLPQPVWPSQGPWTLCTGLAQQRLEVAQKPV